MAYSEDFSKIIMNPVRMRIIQYLLLHEKGTAAEIGNELSDIPKASLYRHLKVLENADLILVVQENKKRGTIEKVYEINKLNTLGGGKPGTVEIEQLIQGMLFCIMGDFRRYFKKKDISPEKDLLALSSSTLLLSDEEFHEFFEKIEVVYSEVLDNKPDGMRKPRRITMISSPADGREDGQEDGQEEI